MFTIFDDLSQQIQKSKKLQIRHWWLLINCGRFVN